MARRPEKMRGAPRADRPLRERGALPSQASLAAMPVERMAAVLGRFGMEPDLAALEARADAAWRPLEAAVADGREPDDALWEKIDERIESAVKEGVRQMVKAAIRNRGTARAVEAAGPGGALMWLTSEDDDVCRSCEPRHGQVDTAAGWRRRGLPGSPSLVCGAEDRCRLVALDE